MSKIRIVLVNPSHPGNVGAAARAMKTMGLSHLVLVAPRVDQVLEHPDALAFAAGAVDVLQAAIIYTSLDEALKGCVWSAALTARLREFSPPQISARQAALKALELTAIQQQVAFVFGSERYGLDNADVLKCQVCCTIATDVRYSSLNLAQAIQVITYECRQAFLAQTELPMQTQAIAALVSHEEREQLLTHIEQVLIAIDFLDPQHPKKLIERLRLLLARQALEHQEIQILRGICKAILKAI